MVVRGRRLDGDLPASLFPQAHVAPAGALFSVWALSQVHCPAGRAPERRISTDRSQEVMFGQGGVGYIRQEQRGPATVFSVEAFSHEQSRADLFPQEHVALEAQTQVPCDQISCQLYSHRSLSV